MADLDEVESRRLQLEENVAKLRKSLQQWRTWDFEYEGLKEEISNLEDVQSEADCIRISNELGGELVTQKEIFELFGVGKGALRERDQVRGFVDRRQDYVQENIRTISKQLQSAEDELEQFLNEQDQGDDYSMKPGLPMTEIIEELDEEGNVINSKVMQPETATAQIIDTLRKAGLADLDPDSKGSEASRSASGEDNSAQAPPTRVTKQVATNGSSSDGKVISSIPGSNEKGKGSDSKKSVKFAEDVQEFTIPKVDNSPTNQFQVRRPDPNLLAGTFSGGDRVFELDDDDEVVAADVVVPEDESPEDARLRREMLQYSLNEVGSVVAELDLDETYTDDEEDYDLEDEMSFDSEMEDDEDEHGRSLRKGVSKSYREQMLELEEKLSARMIENIGPQPDDAGNPDIDPEDLRRLVVRKDEDMPSQRSATAKNEEPSAIKERKAVRFAEALDVSDAPTTSPAAAAPTSQPAIPTKSAPIAESIVERAGPATMPTPTKAAKPAKISRFKSSRIAPDPTPPPHEPGVSAPQAAAATQTQADAASAILSSQIVERSLPPSSSGGSSNGSRGSGIPTAPNPEDTEYNPELQQRQLASEYYRMRNNMIRQQGGFKSTEDESEQHLVEEDEDGQVKRVSRFKAARLKF